MDAWADGLNYYLATHPEVQPRVLNAFEPWMALSFTEGSIGGDIEQIELGAARGFYGGDSAPRDRARAPATSPEPRGSNGIAIAPVADPRRPCAAADQSAHQLLLPLRAADDERRGAERLWRGDLGPVLHLPGLQRARRLDAHLERRRFGRRVRRDDRHAGATAVATATAAAAARWAFARSASATAPPTAGWPRAISPPIARITARSSARDGDAGSPFALMNRPVEALQQSFLRTKASDLQSFIAGRAAAGQFAPTTRSSPTTRARSPICIRSSCRAATTASTIRKPVDGSDPATDWAALHSLTELAQCASSRPTAGSTTPMTGPGRPPAPYSPQAGATSPVYGQSGENPRGIHAQHC